MFRKGDMRLGGVLSYRKGACIKVWHRRTKSFQQIIGRFELCTSANVVSTFSTVGDETIHGSLMLTDMLYNDSERMGIG